MKDKHAVPIFKGGTIYEFSRLNYIHRIKTANVQLAQCQCPVAEKFLATLKCNQEISSISERSENVLSHFLEIGQAFIIYCYLP